MFYLKSLFNLIKEKPLFFLFNFLFSTLVLLTIATMDSHKKIYDYLANQNQSKNTEGRFFYTLIYNYPSPHSIVKKIKNLPGVYSVKVDDKQKLKTRVQNILQKMSFSLPEGILPKEQFGVKVYLDESVTQKSVSLMQEYIKRMVGGDKVLFKDSLNRSRKSRDKSLESGGSTILLFYGILSFCWFLSFYGLSKPLRNRAYLITQYQRRSRVALKIWSGQIFICLLLCFLILIMTPYYRVNSLSPRLFVFVTLFVIVSSLPFLRKAKWSYSQ